MKAADIAKIIKSKDFSVADGEYAIEHLLTDSRTLIEVRGTLFFAIQTKRNSGCKYVAELYNKGVRAFVMPTATDDAVSNITAVSNTAATITSPYYLGGPYSNSYTYDDADRLVSAVGTGLSLSMTYSPAGRIGTKVQSSSGTYNTNNNLLYAYCNETQPHAVRRVWNSNNKLWNDFIYDANGNLAQHTRQGSIDDTRTLYWTEDSRLYASVDENYVSLYGYDPSGERYSKVVGPSSIMDINAVERQAFSFAEDVTLYPSPYIVASKYGYTKYIYAGSDRVCTKIGEGGIDSLYQVSDSLQTNARRLIKRQLEVMPGRNIDVTPVSCNRRIDGTPGNDINSHQIEKKSVQVFVEFGYNLLHEAMDYACTYHGTESQRYFYHPDHLGSASWITDSAGQPIQHLQYLPYGETRIDQHPAGYSERYTFSGKEKDSETGYYYFGARYYNPDLSLWLSVDPMSDKYPSLSPYNYCAWNPMKLVDPNGDTLIAKDAMSQHDIKSVAGKYQDRISFDENGVASLDYTGLNDNEKSQMLKNKGVGILSDIINSKEKILYEASDLILATTPDGEKISGSMENDHNGVVNLSKGGYDSNGGHTYFPQSGYDGQVIVSQMGKWHNKKGFDARVEIISHEIAENYARTVLKYNYHGENSAHVYANKRMGNLNSYYIYTPGKITAQARGLYYKKLERYYAD